MRALQLATLGLFGLFAVLTVFFQFRVGMKGGEAARSDGSDSARGAGQKYSRLAGRCAILAAVMLVFCMICGAINR